VVHHTAEFRPSQKDLAKLILVLAITGSIQTQNNLKKDLILKQSLMPRYNDPPSLTTFSHQLPDEHEFRFCAGGQDCKDH
jgi:hypothetical protein